MWNCLEQSYTKLNICLVFQLRQLEAPYGEKKKRVWIEQNRTWCPWRCHTDRQILMAYIELTSACSVCSRIPTHKNEQNYCVIRRVLKSSRLSWLHHVHVNTYMGFASSWCLTKRIFLYGFWYVVIISTFCFIELIREHWRFDWKMFQCILLSIFNTNTCTTSTS